jgi:polyphosphate kinase
MSLKVKLPHSEALPTPPKLRLTEEHFINRELSWLAFNSRVLDEAARADLPVLERVKFLAITASNLDEFFMVRVGGLQLLREQGLRARDNAGLTPTQQWEQIHQHAATFVARQYDILNQQLMPLLHEKGIPPPRHRRSHARAAHAPARVLCRTHLPGALTRRRR